MVQTHIYILCYASGILAMICTLMVHNFSLRMIFLAGSMNLQWGDNAASGLNGFIKYEMPKKNCFSTCMVDIHHMPVQEKPVLKDGLTD